MAARHLVLDRADGRRARPRSGSAAPRRLGRPFVDTDELVEAARGRAVAEIFERRRRGRRSASCERDAVADACASPDPLVIACGGGAVLDPENRRRAARRRRRGVAARAARGARGARRRRRRPAAARGGDPTAHARAARRAARAPRTRPPPTCAVDTDGRDVDEVADAVRRGVRRRGTRDASRSRRPRRYDVVVGAGALAGVGRACSPGAAGSRS